MLKDHKAPKCSKQAPVEVKSLLHACRRSLLESVADSRQKTLIGTCSNMSSLMRWAMQLMKANGWATLPYDKEPGVCIVHRDVVKGVHEEVLRRGCYEPVGEDPELLQRCLRTSYFQLTKEVGKIDGASMQWTIDRSMNEAKFWYSSRLLLTVKSHKSPVEFRNVHSSSQSVFAGLSCWLTCQLQPILNAEQHILRDCPEFVRRLRLVPHPEETDTMIRIDIKEFFMSGTAEQLSSTACQIIPGGPRRELVQRVARFLLESQYLFSSRTEGLWRVTQGSGQGQQHSGAIADAVFLVLVDWWVRRASVLKAFSVKEYCRFKDDIFMITGDKKRWKDMLHCMKHRCRGIYRLWVERVSSENCVMLAVQVHRREGQWTAFPKDRVRGVPLGTDSAHASNLHWSWPVGQLRMIKSLCTSQNDVSMQQQIFIEWFQRCLSPLWLVAWLRWQADKQAKSVQTQICDRSRSSWIVLPHHPALRASSLKRSLDKTLSEWTDVWKFVWGKARPDFRIAWSLPKQRFGDMTGKI